MLSSVITHDLTPPAVRRRARRVGAWLAAALALVAGTTGDPALAQSLSPATVTVTDFAPVVLNGEPATTTASMADFTVTDSAGAGWHVSVQATQFAEVNGSGEYVTGGKTLPAGSLAMSAPTVTPADALVSVAPGPYAIDGAAVQIITALAGATGTFQVTQAGALTLSIPSSAYARSYRSDVTVSVHSGP